MKEGEVEGFLEKKNALKTESESEHQDLENLKTQRRKETRKIAVSELPEEERFQALNNRSKHFVDTLKIVAYRAETALAQTLAESMHAHHRDKSRGLAQQIMATEANLRPDPGAGTLTVEIHSLSTPLRQRRARKPVRRTDRNPNKLPGHKPAPHLQEGIITPSVEVRCSESGRDASWIHSRPSPSSTTSVPGATIFSR